MVGVNENLNAKGERKRNVTVLTFSFLLLISLCSYAQPGTDIYLFKIKNSKGEIILTDPENITQRRGYDNQPYFHPSKGILYFASADSSGHTDILTYDLSTKTTRNFTTTIEREYSPTVTPDKKGVSCIIQRADGTQDLGNIQ